MQEVQSVGGCRLSLFYWPWWNLQVELTVCNPHCATANFAHSESHHSIVIKFDTSFVPCCHGSISFSFWLIQHYHAWSSNHIWVPDSRWSTMFFPVAVKIVKEHLIIGKSISEMAVVIFPWCSSSLCQIPTVIDVPTESKKIKKGCQEGMSLKVPPGCCWETWALLWKYLQPEKLKQPMSANFWVFYSKMKHAGNLPMFRNVQGTCSHWLLWRLSPLEVFEFFETVFETN